ncbi:MAG TPA: PKD domain-containing protein [Thermoanaerobaculia bacterium]|nr:PKD domain-containing protein [Thermoanaerobaculia bacterium]
MSRNRILVATFAATLTAFAAHGDSSRALPRRGGTDGPALFHVQDEKRSRPPAAGWQAVEGAIEEFDITVDPETVAADPEVVRIDLPSGLSLEAVRSSFTDYGPEWKSWTGTLRLAGATDQGDGYAYLGYHGDRITGVLHFEGERYQITGGLDGPQRLVRQSDELTGGANCGLHVRAGARAIPSKGDRPGRPASGDSPPTLGEKTLTRIDVMALYPRAYFVSPAAEIGLVDHVEDTIAQANTIFVNSLVNAYYNLVHVGPIVDTQPSLQGPQGGLDLLNAQTSEVNTLRDAYGADFVTMFVPFFWTGTTLSGPPCGVANMPVLNPSGIYDTTSGEVGLLGVNFGIRTYSAQREGCGFGDFTLAHEMGHNWGMWHDTPYPSSIGTLMAAYADAYYLSAVDKNTAMGCFNAGGAAGTAAVCKRIPYFSDDTALYLGSYATGDTNHRNALMARSRLGSYPLFKSQQTISPPVASFTRSCNSGTRTCSFNASGTTDNGTVTKYQWDFGDGTAIVTTTSPTINHTYGGSGTFYWVHLLATDNVNQRDLAADTATF